MSKKNNNKNNSAKVVVAKSATKPVATDVHTSPEVKDVNFNDVVPTQPSKKPSKSSMEMDDLSKTVISYVYSERLHGKKYEKKVEPKDGETMESWNLHVKSPKTGNSIGIKVSRLLHSGGKIYSQQRLGITVDGKHVEYRGAAVRKMITILEKEEIVGRGRSRRVKAENSKEDVDAILKSI